MPHTGLIRTPKLRKKEAKAPLVVSEICGVGKRGYVTRKAKKLPRIHSKIEARRSKMGPVKKKLPLAG